MSQESLAAAADIDRTYISGIERGVRNISLLTLARIARALHVKISDLIEKL